MVCSNVLPTCVPPLCPHFSEAPLSQHLPEFLLPSFRSDLRSTSSTNYLAVPLSRRCFGLGATDKKVRSSGLGPRRGCNVSYLFRAILLFHDLDAISFLSFAMAFAQATRLCLLLMPWSALALCPWLSICLPPPPTFPATMSSTPSNCSPHQAWQSLTTFCCPANQSSQNSCLECLIHDFSMAIPAIQQAMRYVDQYPLWFLALFLIWQPSWRGKWEEAGN